MSKLNKIVNDEMLNKIVNSISEETIVDFCNARSDKINYISILKQIDDFIFENLDLFEKEVVNFEDFVERKRKNEFETIEIFETFEFEFISERQEICFYISSGKICSKLLNLYYNIANK